MATYNERIKELRIKKHLTLKDIAKKLNITEATAQRYESGNGIKAVPYEKIVEYAQLFGVSPCYIMGWEDESKNIKDSVSTILSTNLPHNVDIIIDTAVAIPLLGRVAAGTPLYAEGNVIGKVYVGPDITRDGSGTFALRVKGDSMFPTLHDGDTIIVRQQNDADSGQIVVAMINGDEAVVKKLQKYKDGIALISVNPAYEPMHFTNKEIEELPVTIAGKVIECRSQL